MSGKLLDAVNEFVVYRELMSPVISNSGKYVDKYEIDLKFNGKTPSKLSSSNFRNIRNTSNKLYDNNENFNLLANQVAAKVTSVFNSNNRNAIKKVLSVVYGEDIYMAAAVSNDLNIPLLIIDPAKIDLEESRFMLYDAGKSIEFSKQDMHNFYAVHYTNVINSGYNLSHDTMIPIQSHYFFRGGAIPTIRRRNAKVENVVNILDNSFNVTAEELGILVNSIIEADEDFFEKHSINPAEMFDYRKNPKEWTAKYLKNNPEFMDSEVASKKLELFRGIYFPEVYNDKETIDQQKIA